MYLYIYQKKKHFKKFITKFFRIIFLLIGLRKKQANAFNVLLLLGAILRKWVKNECFVTRLCRNEFQRVF